MQTAVFALGCFWCGEAVFRRLKGVTGVISGYTGGTTPNPTYEKVSMGNTGHAEAIKITFDPNLISYEDLLNVFWEVHGPTTPNQQGADVGTQYRSAIFYADEKQKEIAEESLSKAQEKLESKIVTEIVPFKEFFPAELNHQKYYENNGSTPYCKLVVDPKIQTLFKHFPELTQ